jgi:hypothetical protein
MTDQQIEDAYRRMDTALTPPTDVVARVERRIRVRRSRRRVALAGVAGLVVAGTVSGALLLGGGDGQDGDSIATDPPTPHGVLVLTRPDGSTYEMSDLTVSCDPPPFFDGLEVPKDQTHIWLYSPLDASKRDVLKHPFAYFEAIVAEVDGRTFQLPVTQGDDPGERPFTLFAADQDARPDEHPVTGFSSSELGAAGTVVVKRASCDPAPVLELEVDTTLGSEVQQGTLGLVGSYH